MKQTLLMITLLLSSLGFSKQVTTKSITIHPYLSFQNYEHFKRLTLSSPDSNVEFISGFNFEWGYTYTLKVQETKLVSTLSDGTSFEYALKKVITKTKEPDSRTFTLLLDANRYYYQVDADEEEMNKTFHAINDSTFSYFDKVEIEVASSVKDTFKTILEGKTKKIGTFLFVNEKRIRLVKL